MCKAVLIIINMHMYKALDVILKQVSNTLNTALHNNMDGSDNACGAQLSQEHDGQELQIAFLPHTFT